MNPSSTEDYLDSLLRAIQQKEEPEPQQEEIKTGELEVEVNAPEEFETEVIEPELAEEAEILPDIFSFPEEQDLPENLEIQEEDLPEILEIQEENQPEILEIQEENQPEILEIQEEDLPEILEIQEENLPEILEIQEEDLPEILEIQEEDLPEILEVQEEELPEFLEFPDEIETVRDNFEAADESTLLNDLLDDPNKPLSPEEIQAMFSQIEGGQTESSDDEQLSIDDVKLDNLFETVTDADFEGAVIDEGLDIEDELPPLEEVLGRLSAEYAGDMPVSDAPVFDVPVSDAPVFDEPVMFADEIENLSEDDIMNLLNQSSVVDEENDVSIDALFGEVAEEIELDALLDNMSDDTDIAGLQDLFDKSQNNEPVSAEVEDMIADGLKVEAFAETVEETAEAEPPKTGLFGKLKEKFFSKKEKKNKAKKQDEIDESENVSVAANNEGAVQSIPESMLFDDAPSVEQAEQDLDALFTFPEESNFANVFDAPEAADSLKDLMAETGGLMFDGVQDNGGSGFSFDQLFEDTSNVGSDKSEMSDISDLLKSLESTEGQSDIFAAGDDLFSGMESDEAAVEIGTLLEGVEEQEPKNEKKPGLFSRLITFLTAEDEDEEDNQLKGEGVEKLGVTSDENKEALEQLDKEGDGKKKKKKNGKKGKTEDSEDDEFNEDEEPQENKKKKKKAKKEKKEKEPKLVEDENTPVLSKKKIRSTFLFSFTIMAAILVCCLFVPDLFEKQKARNAFYDGEYESCYQSLYGKKLSESDRLIFEKAGFMLALERRTDAYNNYMAVGDEMRAVESLIQEVVAQDEVLRNAEEYDLTTEAEQSYQDVLNILSERYQVTEADALLISGYKQDALFTLHLKAIVAGEEFVCPDYLREDGQVAKEDTAGSAESVEEDTTKDLLPAEEELTETEFEEGTN